MVDLDISCGKGPVYMKDIAKGQKISEMYKDENEGKSSCSNEWRR